MSSFFFRKVKAMLTQKEITQSKETKERAENEPLTLALMDTLPVKLPTHKHPLHRSSRYIINQCCDVCLGQPIYEGYRCNDSECNHVWFHKECAESRRLVFNHSLHPRHLLVLSQLKDSPYECNSCGEKLTLRGYGLHSTGGYRCSLCDFEVHLACVINPQPLETIHSVFHDHHLVRALNGSWFNFCKVCTGVIREPYLYECPKSSVKFHARCATLEEEVNHLYHSKHPLMLLNRKSLTADIVDKTCILCGEEPLVMLYHCSICNITLCLYCTASPPPVVVQHGKTHEHQLFLMPSRISFTCNICGMQGDQSPYLCLQCGFCVHRVCIDLPRVININRHDHRVSFVQQLGPGYLSCNVCHKNIDQYYGGYACSVCPNYAVHSQCAVRKDVWEGIELENIPEEIEDIAPFVVVGDNLIKHFSHDEHNLRLFNEGAIFHDESTRCRACIRPVYDDPTYNCEQCDFLLHEKCANLPRKKRLMFSNKPFTLHTTIVDPDNHFLCTYCETRSSGFRYVSRDIKLDIFCALFAEPFMHDGHPHPLYHGSSRSQCSACLKCSGFEVMHCDTCEFHLCFDCANMPKKVKSKFDDHPLILCYGETEKTSSSGKYWCDICEMETDPTRWFYTCSDCGVTLHVKCVLGVFSHLMPGSIIELYRVKFKVVSNIHNSTRPFCLRCHSRGIVPHMLKLCDPFHGDQKYICSETCGYIFKPEDRHYRSL